jgi:outer membrane immunogenic protein
MKKLMLLAVAFFTFNTLNAQCPINKGQAQLNAGFGFSSSGIPVYIGMDFGVHKDVTVGGEASFRSYNENWNGNKYRQSALGLAINGNYHFNHLLEIPLEWDFYAGANVGFYIWNSPDDYYGDTASGLGIGIQVGGRYYFNDKMGINLEFGGGNAFSGGKIGISIKL